METQTRKLSQDQDLNTARFLFASKPKDLIPLIAEGIQRGDALLRFFGTFEGHIFDAVDYLIMNFHKTDSGRITTGMLFKALKEVAATYDMARFSISPLSSNGIPRNASYKTVIMPEGENNPFAVGVLDEDYCDGDNDPYQTAGGYRNWKALKGTKVEYFLNPDLSVRASFESNCLVDHYNNNIAGLSTGGGTKTYQLGERVEKRGVALGTEWNYWEFKKNPFKATVLEVDGDKACALAKEFVPEFSFLFK